MELKFSLVSVLDDSAIEPERSFLFHDLYASIISTIISSPEVDGKTWNVLSAVPMRMLK
jgi:hypothetical protein